MSTAASIRPSPAMLQQRQSSAPAGGGISLDPIRLAKKYYLLLIVAAVVGAVVGAAAHFILARVAPQYTAQATFACYPQATSTYVINTQGFQQDDLNRFMGTQMATMTSRPILDKVLDEPEVEGTAWARQFFYNGKLQKQNAQPELEKAVYARAIPQTSLIRLSMTWRNPDDTRVIVDAVTRVYQQAVRNDSSVESVARREVLNKEIAKLDFDIKQANEERDRILQANSITDIGSGIAQEDIRVKELSERYVNIVTAIASTKSQHDRYRQMQEEGGIIAYPDYLREVANRDPIVGGLDAGISAGRTDYATLKAQGYGDEHPTVIAIRKRIEATQQERNDKYDTSLRKIFDAEVDSLGSQIVSLEAQKKQVDSESLKVDMRKQDLTRLRIKLDDIAGEVARRVLDRSEQEAARKQLELLLGNPVFDRVRLIVPAALPQTMSFPKLSILIPFGIVLFAGLTAGLVVLREVLDQRVRGPADLATVARIRVLGLVADAQEDPARPSNLATAFRDAPTGVTAESFRLLRAPVIKGMDQAGHKSLLVLAGMPGSGATTVATNLGLACAGADERVLIIDANLRRPGIQKAFGLPDGPGLGDVLAGASKLDDAVRATSAQNLYVLTGGSASHRAMPERLASETMARVLAEAKGKFDRIIIDSAPAIVSGDGFTLANRVDCVALVVRALNEKRGLVARLRSQLGECRGEFLGVVVNAVRASAGGYLRGNIKATHEYQHGAQAA